MDDPVPLADRMARRIEIAALMLIAFAPYLAIYLDWSPEVRTPVFGAASWVLMLPAGLLAMTLLLKARSTICVAASHAVGVGGMAAFWTASLFSAAYVAVLPTSAWISVLGVSTALVIALWALVGERRGEASARKLFVAISCWMPAIVSMPFLMQSIGLGEWNPLSQDAVPGFGNVRRFEGMVLVFAATMSGWALARPAGARGLFQLAHVFAVLGWMILFWCGGRGSIIALIIGLGIVSLAFRRPVRGLFLLMLHGASGAILSLFLWRPYVSFSAVHRLLDNRQPGDGVSSLSSGRTDVWKWTLEHIMERPLLGHGAKQFYAYHETHSHAHNTPLELLFSYGIFLGSLPVLLGAVVLALGFRRLWRKDRPLEITAAAAVPASALSLSGMLTDLGSAPLMLSALAVSLAVIAGQGARTRSRDEATHD